MVQLSSVYQELKLAMTERRKVTAVLTYPNRHIVDVFESLENHHGYQVSFFFFQDIPEFRKANHWSIPKNSTMLTLRRPSSYLKLFDSCSDCKALFFQGLLRPFPQNIITQSIVRQNRFILSEGSRRKRRRNILTRSFLKLLFNRPATQHLSIGTGASRDYFRAGLTKWKYRKFGFCEVYPEVKGATWDVPDEDTIVLLCVGRLLARKNFKQLIESLRDYRETRKITVVICGEGEEEPNLRKLTKLLPHTVTIHFAGHCDKHTLAQYYRRADVFVLTSTYEGWGVVVNQALHFGLPLVLRNTVRSGIDYLLLENKNGFSFTCNKSLLTAIEKLVLDDSLRLKMSRESSKHNELWSMDTITTRLSMIIQNPDVQFESGPLSTVLPS